MLPDRVSNPGPLTYESGAQPIALHGLALLECVYRVNGKHTTVQSMFLFTKSTFNTIYSRRSVCFWFLRFIYSG